MKITQQSLLIFLALGLCGLCTRQWYNQATQHAELTSLSQTIADQSAAVQQQKNSIAVMDTQIAAMDSHLTELKSTIKSNAAEILALRAENDQLTGTIVQYKQLTKTLESRVKQANTIIKDITEQRDDFLKRLNETIQDRNEVVAKYNMLVKQLSDRQATQKK